MLRILLIDDNFDVHLSITRQLKQEFSPIEVTSIIHAKSFEEALAIGDFDIAITDYSLYWTNGLEVLKTIKARYPNCPVIMYTDSGNEEIAVLGMKSGLSDYVLKGRLELLVIAIRESLEKQTSLDEYAVAVEQLRISEERLDVAMEAAHLGTWDWNMITNQVIWSKNHEQLFGLTSGGFLGSYESFLSCVHPQDREQVSENITHALETKTEYNGEFRVVWPDQSIHWILSRGNFYYNDAGEPIRMIGVVSDLTERKQREEELERANRLKDEFLAIVSHELRTPLNAILGWAQLLRSRNFDEATRNHSLEIIERSALQQNQLINDILDTSRLMRGQMQLSISPINLVSVIENTLNTLQLSAEGKSITLESVLEHSVAVVMGDENRLYQIVWNLLSNAIKFTPVGGRVEVRLSISASSNSCDSQLNTQEPQSYDTYDNGGVRASHVQASRMCGFRDLNRLALGLGNFGLSTPRGWGASGCLLPGELEAPTQKPAPGGSPRQSAQVGKPAHAAGSRCGDCGGLPPLKHLVWSPSSSGDWRWGLGVEGNRGQDPPLGISSKDVTRAQSPRTGNPLAGLPHPNAVASQRSQPFEVLSAENFGSDNCWQSAGFWAVIQVSDTGEGINSEFLPHVFEHFRQADSTTTRSNNGLGLGLAIVRHLVELHTGIVTAESQGKGKGATFTVKLPLIQENTPQPKVSRERTFHHSQLNDVQILVVDDDTDTLDLLQEILQGAGAKVTTVSSANAALQVLQEFKFDVLISDIGMPQTSGYALIRQVRVKEVGQTQKIAAVALTGYSTEEDKFKALEAGFHIFLSKPVNPVDLIGAISSLLE
ncbi:response regulator [Scytonema tolypothrichoides VB-61278]|nr:response regulator [Scytonema tolypothrichoides VB-61278]